jgi:hypothetical protein
VSPPPALSSRLSARRIHLLFYLSTLLSSVGSMTFVVCLLVFLLKSGYSLAVAGAITGGNRLVPLVVNLLFGDAGDRVRANRLLIGTEVVAALLTGAMIVLWGHGQDAIALFVAASFLRASVVTLQMGARAKVSKLLSDSSYASNSKQAIWLNKTTQGATIFAGVIGWYAINNLSLEWVMAFDGLSYLFGGAIMLFVPAPPPSTQPRTSITAKFRALYTASPRAAVADVVLAMAAAGATSFSARLAGPDLSWAALLMSAYGVSVWVTGFLERTEFVRGLGRGLWVALAVSLMGLGAVAGTGWLTWARFLSRDVFRWTLFHRVTAYIQADAPASQMAAVSAARSVQMTAIIASGEFLVGAWKDYVTVQQEGLIRGGLCLAFFLITALSPRWRSSHADRPAI